MRVRDETVGALSLFRDRANRLDGPEVPVAQGMPDTAAIALMQERSVREPRGLAAQLQSALSSRVLIEQGKGVLAERAPKSAWTPRSCACAAYARTSNLKVGRVAQELFDGGLDPETLSGSDADDPLAQRRDAW